MNKPSMTLELLEQMVLELCDRVRAEVHPHLGQFAARGMSGRAIGGDATLAIDDVAEEVIADFLEEEGNLAVYTEDLGLVSKGEPQAVLVVDPVDGTRPAVAGLESCCVSIAATLNTESPVMGDVDVGVVRELKWDRTFVAVRGEGVRIIGPGGADEELVPTQHDDLSALFWASGFRGRPYRPVSAIIADLADGSTLKGSIFDLGSASFIMTRLLTGQLDAYVDPGKRVIEEFPGLEEEFVRVGGGSVLCNSPYDVAASLLILEEAGAVATDAWGRDVSDLPMLGSDKAHQLSILAASNASLHAKLLEALDAGFDRLAAEMPELERAPMPG